MNILLLLVLAVPSHAAPVFTGDMLAPGLTVTSSVTFTSNVLGGSSVTASAFFGDGSHLSGISSSGAGSWFTIATGTYFSNTSSTFTIALLPGQAFASSQTYRVSWAYQTAPGSSGGFPCVRFNNDNGNNYAASGMNYGWTETLRDSAQGFSGTLRTCIAITGAASAAAAYPALISGGSAASGQFEFKTQFGHPNNVDLYGTWVGDIVDAGASQESEGNYGGQYGGSTSLSSMQWACQQGCGLHWAVEQYNSPAAW